jgi:D-xylose transport system permease protein
MATTDVDDQVGREPAPETPAQGSERGLGSLVRSTGFDPRLLGMVVALALIWVGFHVMSGGTFLSSRNLWNLTVQFTPIAIMATGMVLVIVSRNIDLSVGSMMGLVGMAMALLQVEILPAWMGFDHPLLWIITLAAGIALGAAIGAFQGAIVAYVGVPSFIVTLGGLLVWRGVAFVISNGRTIAPLDSTFRRIGGGGGAQGAIGGAWSWAVGFVALAGIIALLVSTRRQRKRFGFRLRPMWAEVFAAVSAGVVVLGGIAVLNQYYLPEALALQLAEQQGIPIPDGGLQIPIGLAYPVLIAIGVALVMTYLATRRRFGRYVYAIGGNPEAAELAGIKTRMTTVKIFTLMGVLVAIAAAVQTARLDAGVDSLGQVAELFVIAAAVIGGTSLAGGIGTIVGAMLGALLMQSLQSGMVLVGADSPVQRIVVGIVLVMAVAIDVAYRRRQTT